MKMSQELDSAIREAFWEITGLKAMRVFQVGFNTFMVEAVDGNKFIMGG
jgi:hypothetical protein